MASLGKYSQLLLILIFVIPALLLAETIEAQAERVTTSCAIFVDNIVEGQPVTVTIQMSPVTPTGEGYTQVTIWVTSPQGVIDNSVNGSWLKSISTDPSGRATITFGVATFSGKWYVNVEFGSHYYANYSMLYLAGEWQTEFTVSPRTPTPSPTAAPTTSPSSTANPTPTVPEFPIAKLLIVFLTAVSLIVIISKRRTISKNML